MDLVEFLTARLDEDEQVARAAGDDRWALIPVYEDATIRHDRMPEPRSIQMVEANGEEVGNVHGVAHAEHIARHDPARVLAEVDAKRRVLGPHGPAEFEYSDVDVCSTCDRGGPLPFPCPTLRLLALPYSDHPDYDEAWRP